MNKPKFSLVPQTGRFTVEKATYGSLKFGDLFCFADLIGETELLCSLNDPKTRHENGICMRTFGPMHQALANQLVYHVQIHHGPTEE